MPTIRIRDVPEDIHRSLKVRAARAGLPLSDFLLREVTQIALRPSLDEVLDRIAARKPPGKPVDSVTAVRSEREGHR